MGKKKKPKRRESSLSEPRVTFFPFQSLIFFLSFQLLYLLEGERASKRNYALSTRLSRERGLLGLGASVLSLSLF
jgi:hypothetical protein